MRTNSTDGVFSSITAFCNSASNALLDQVSYIKRKASVLQAHLCAYSPAIKSAVVEFYKGLCFFILAIEIAANIVVR